MLRRVAMGALVIALGFSHDITMAGDTPNGTHCDLNIIVVPKNNRPDDSKLVPAADDSAASC